MEEKNKIIPVYLLVIFMAVFIGTGVFLILNNKKLPSGKEAASTAVKQTQGSLNLELSGNETLSVNKEFAIDVVADSNKKNIVGYDLVLYYDTSSFEFVNATSNITDFKIYSYSKGNYLSFLATKTLQGQASSVFTQTKIASIIFKPKKAGKFNFALKPLLGGDKTDLVTDKTEVLNPGLNELKVEVF